MDLFDYASELFDQTGHLHVPGLGHFAKTRKGSYYAEGSLHPPVNQISFKQSVDEHNDELVSYFAREKRISPASAKYFVDKLVEQLKSQATTAEANFADLGIFYTENGVLAFKPKQTNTENDPSLFGYAPVALPKLADRKNEAVAPKPRLEEQDIDAQAGPEAINNPVIAENLGVSDQPKLSVTKPAGSGEPVIILNSSLGRDQEKGTNPLLWTLYVVLAMAVIGVLFWYYNTHNLANEKVNSQNNPVNQSYNIEKAKVKANATVDPVIDTTNNQAASGDTVQTVVSQQTKQVLQPPAKTTILANSAPETFKDSWVISGGQNNNYAGATRLLARYRGQGFPQARLLDSVKKKEWFIYRVIFGFYDTKQQALAARHQLLRNGKLNTKYITVQPTNK